MTVAEYQQAQKDIAEIKAQIAQLRDVVAKGVPAVREIYGADLPTPEPLPEAGASYPNVGALQFQQGKMMAGVEAAKKAVMPTTEALGAIRGNPEEQGTIENIARGGAALIATAPAMLPLTVEQSVAGGVERGNPLAPATDMAQAIGQTFQRQVTGEAGGVTRGEAWSKTPVEEAFNLATPLLAGLGIAKAGLPKKMTIKEARAAINDIGKPKVDVPEVVQEPIRSEMPVEQPATATEVVAKAKPNLVTGNVKQLTPDELTAAQARLREKFKPMDEAIATSTQPVEKAITSRQSETRDALGKMLVKDAIATKDAEIGTNILLDMSERGFSPQKVHEEFINNVYDRLPEDIRAKFNRLIEKQTGEKVGQYWKDHKTMAKELIDLGDDAEMLEGTERGFAVMEAEAVKRFSGEGVPLIGENLKQPTAEEHGIRRPIRNKQILDAVNEKIKNGGDVILSTHTKHTRITKPEHLRVNSAGDLQIVRGKNWDTVTEQYAENLAEQAGLERAKSLLDNLPEIDYASIPPQESHYLFLERGGKKYPVAGPYPDAAALEADRPRIESLLEKANPTSHFDTRVYGKTGSVEAQLAYAKRIDQLKTMEGYEPTATVQDAAVRPAQSIKPTESDIVQPNIKPNNELSRSPISGNETDFVTKQPWEVRKNEYYNFVKRDTDDLYQSYESARKSVSKISERIRLEELKLRTLNGDAEAKQLLKIKKLKDEMANKQSLNQTANETLKASLLERQSSNSDFINKGIYFRKGDQFYVSNHRDLVAQALKDGKPVPPEVLADYPDLAAKYGKPTTAEAVVKKAGEKAQTISSAAREITTEALAKNNKSQFKRTMFEAIDGAIEEAHGIEDYGGLKFPKEGDSFISPDGKKYQFVKQSGYKGVHWYRIDEIRQPNGTIIESSTREKPPIPNIDKIQQSSSVGGTQAYVDPKTPKITIHIPGDGDFTIYNTKEHLSALKDAVNRGTPETKVRPVGEYTFEESFKSADPVSMVTKKKLFVGENPFLSKEQMAKYFGKKDAPPPTELHAGVNPFKIIDDYMTKRKLVNPFGTPEIVLRGKGIVQPLREAGDLMRNDLTVRGEKLRSMLEGVKRDSPEDYAVFGKLDDPNAVLPKREQEIRNYLDELLGEVNKHREARGQEPVKYRKGYITHLPTDAKMSEILDILESASADYGDTPMPKKFRFQFEKARKGDPDYKLSAIDALEVYTQAALKDIYIGDALAKAIPNVEALGGKPLLVKNSFTTPDGKTVNITEYRWTDSPIMTERGYAEAFIKGQMNVPTIGQRALKAMFDIRPNTSMKVAHATTGTFYRSLLGFAVDSGTKNLTQNINTLAEYGVLPSMKGFAKFVTPEGFKEAKAQHLLDDFNPMLLEGHDLPMKSKVGRAIGKGFAASLNAPMKVAEFINRGIAYHTAYDVNIKKGLPLEAAHDLAREGVRKTQFSYSKVDTSPALRGPFARLATQFLSYPIKQSELMYKWATMPGEQGKLARYFLYTGMAIMGAKYAGIDVSGVFFDPIRMVDPNSKEGMNLPWSDKRVAFDFKKFAQTGYAPQGFAPLVSIPRDFIKSQMSDDESTREYGRTKALTNIIPGGRYGKKVYDVITESDEKGKRDRLTRENTDKDKTLKLLGFRGTEREAESSRRESVVEVEKKYYATRQKLIDLKISGNEDEFIKVRDEFRDKYPFLYGRLMKGFGDAVKEERKKKGMTTDERFFDNSLRKQIDANL